MTANINADIDNNSDEMLLTSKKVSLLTKRVLILVVIGQKTSEKWKVTNVLCASSLVRMHCLAWTSHYKLERCDKTFTLHVKSIKQHEVQLDKLRAGRPVQSVQIFLQFVLFANYTVTVLPTAQGWLFVHLCFPARVRIVDHVGEGGRGRYSKMAQRQRH